MNILIALDYTKNRDQLLEKGLQFATAMNASLTLLHVFSFVSETERGLGDAADLSGIATADISKTDFETWRHAAQESEKKLQALVAEIQQAGVNAQGYHIFGQPGPVICARAEQLKADVVMIGRRSNHTRTERALGSVSNFVAQQAPCSVWIIQDQD